MVVESREEYEKDADALHETKEDQRLERLERLQMERFVRSQHKHWNGSRSSWCMVVVGCYTATGNEESSGGFVESLLEIFNQVFNVLDTATDSEQGWSCIGVCDGSPLDQ
jgi:hypothetical protein